MKNIINKILRPFNVELNGIGYLNKLRKTQIGKNAFSQQFEKCKKPTIIFDVGSNTGIITQKYRVSYPDAKIFAFEPFSEFNEEFLRKNKGDSNCYLSNKALSDNIGTSIYYINKSKDTNSLLKPKKIDASSDELCKTEITSVVETDTIDNFCSANKIGHIDILKMDTQGSELSILKGAESMLRNGKIGLIYSECYFQEQYENQPLFYDICLYLKQFDYFIEDIYDPYYNKDFLLWGDAIFLKKQTQ